jgi:hypothetical protein
MPYFVVAATWFLLAIVFVSAMRGRGLGMRRAPSRALFRILDTAYAFILLGWIVPLLVGIFGHAFSHHW